MIRSFPDGEANDLLVCGAYQGSSGHHTYRHRFEEELVGGGYQSRGGFHAKTG